MCIALIWGQRSSDNIVLSFTYFSARVTVQRSKQLDGVESATESCPKKRVQFVGLSCPCSDSPAVSSYSTHQPKMDPAFCHKMMEIWTSPFSLRQWLPRQLACLASIPLSASLTINIIKYYFDNFAIITQDFDLFQF